MPGYGTVAPWEEPDHLDPGDQRLTKMIVQRRIREQAVTGNRLRLGAPSQHQIKLRKTVDRRQDQCSGLWATASWIKVSKRSGRKDRPNLSNKYEVSLFMLCIFRGPGTHIDKLKAPAFNSYGRISIVLSSGVTPPKLFDSFVASPQHSQPSNPFDDETRRANCDHSAAREP